MRAAWSESTAGVFLPATGIITIPGLSVALTTDRAGIIHIQGTVNVFTSKDLFIYVYLDDAQVGVPFYTSETNAWINITFDVMRNVTPGTHTITIRADANLSQARIGSRVVTASAF